MPPLPPGFTLDGEKPAPRKIGEPGISATKPSFLEELASPLIGTPGDRTLLGRAIYGQEATPQAPDYGRGLNLPLVKLEQFIPGGTIPTEYARGLLSAGSELTTPANAALLGGVGAATQVGGKVLARLISAGFSADMAHGLYQQAPEFKKAADRGDYNQAANIAGQMTATGAFAGVAGRHATKGLLKKAPGAVEPVVEAPKPAEVKPEMPSEKPITFSDIQPLPDIPPVPKGFVIDKPVEIFTEAVNNIPYEPTITTAEPVKPARRPRSDAGSRAGDTGNVPQPTQAEIALDPIRAEALDLVDTLAQQYGGMGGIPVKSKAIIYGEYQESPSGVLEGVGGGARRYEGINIDDIPVLQDVPHTKSAIENALASRKGKIYDRIVLEAENTVRRWKEEAAQEAGEAAAPSGPVDVSFNPAEFEPKPAEIVPPVTQKPTSIADFSQSMADAAQRSKGEAANEIIGQLGMKAAGAPKRMADLEGSPLFPKEPEKGLFDIGYTGGPEAGSLPVFIEGQMPLPKYAGSINLERVGADYPVKKLIRDVYDQYKPQIDEARRGVITLEETRKLAEDLNMTEKQLLARRRGKAFNAEEVTASRDILNASSRRLGLLREQWAKSGSEDAVVEFRKALDLHAEIQAEVSGIASEAGRALGAHRIISEPAKGYRQMLDALGGRELNEEILKQFGKVDASDPRQVNAFVRQYSEVTGWDMFYEAWRALLLSGLKTHIVNTTSNLFTLLTRGPETLATATVEAGMSKLQGRPRERFFAEVKPEAIGALAGIKDGARAALAAWREELPLEQEMKIEIHRRAIPGKTGRVIRIPYRALSAADEMFKAINYSAEAHQLAYRKARLAGVPTEQIPEKMAEFITGKDIKEKADIAARYWTFNQPMGPWLSLVNRFRMTVPGAKYVVPFLRTPGNIAKFALERSPLNFFRVLREARRGDLKHAELSEELAKPLLGTMIGAAVTVLAAEGLITGGGPKNQNERETLQRMGWMPYAFKIGDRYYSFGRMEPVGSIVGMAADFVELGGAKNPSEAVQKIASSISKNLTSKTFLQGLSDTLDVLSDPQRFGSKFLKVYAGTLIPNIVGTAAQMVDPVQRITEGPLEAMQAKIPGLSQRLPAKRDLFGREVQKPGESALERGLSPFPVKKISADFVDRELVRIKAWLGDLDKRGMSAEQFDAYAQMVGKTLRPKLELILRQEMNDEIKAEKVKRAASETRLQVKRALGLLRKAS